MTFASLSSLLEALDNAPRSRESYDELLQGIRFGIDEIRGFCHFSQDFYTRNLIARTDSYEILALCWEPGQISPVHDHAGSDGWVCGMDGALEEVWFECNVDADGKAKLERGRAATLTPGAIGYINDDMAWHTVGNVGDKPAVSLHFYSPPIDACQYVDGEGIVRTKQMSYFTVDGTRVAS
jgi:predicted metal-dependent enzyme (double-stranded beta helix superfamily)